ncbi:hypothetical protein AB4Y45_09155 [Paraburkholderia sp. EG287A]|uniref:hypothetical protein n=1 Tax=Paraburkholderia sp. EG287A TaxID=3237012 RepID=UPI0034D2EF70
MIVSRHDFSRATKETLAKRAAQCCTNPDCGRATSGPHEDERKAVNLGVAAHITAAAPGGPRYNKILTPEERSGIGNAIWLCQSCAKLIDSDVIRFPEELLIMWKRKHEEITKQRMISLIASDATRGLVALSISAIYTHLSADKRACVVDFRVSNRSGVDILINAVEFEVLEFFRRFPLGRANYSETYDIDLSETIEYMAVAECQVAQILKPGEADRFAIVVSATSLAAVCAAWKFAVRLKTNHGVFDGPNIDVVFSADETPVAFDVVRRILKEKILMQFEKYSDQLKLNPENRQYIMNARPGSYGGFTTLMGELLSEYSGPSPIVDAE